MKLATQLAVFSEGNHSATPIRPVVTSHQSPIGDAFHLELGCQVVGAASEASVRTFDGRTFAVQRPINAGGKTQRGLICGHPWLVPKSFAALPAYLIVVEVGGSASRAKGHEGSFFLENLLGSVGSRPVDWSVADGGLPERPSSQATPNPVQTNRPVPASAVRPSPGYLE